jgi:hypothetical protein
MEIHLIALVIALIINKIPAFTIIITHELNLKSKKRNKFPGAGDY